MNAPTLRIVSALPHGFVRAGDIYEHPSGARVRRDASGYTLLHTLVIARSSSQAHKPVTLDGYAVFVDSEGEEAIGEVLGKALEMWREIGAETNRRSQ